MDARRCRNYSNVNFHLLRVVYQSFWIHFWQGHALCKFNDNNRLTISILAVVDININDMMIIQCFPMLNFTFKISFFCHCFRFVMKDFKRMKIISPFVCNFVNTRKWSFWNICHSFKIKLIKAEFTIYLCYLTFSLVYNWLVIWILFILLKLGFLDLTVVEYNLDRLLSHVETRYRFHDFLVTFWTLKYEIRTHKQASQIKFDTRNFALNEDIANFFIFHWIWNSMKFNLHNRIAKDFPSFIQVITTTQTIITAIIAAIIILAIIAVVATFIIVDIFRVYVKEGTV